MHRPLPMVNTTCLTTLIAPGQASPPLVILRRVFRAPPHWGRTTSMIRWAPQVPVSHLWKGAGWGSFLGRRKAKLFLLTTPGLQLWWMTQPFPRFVLDWVDPLIHLAFTFLSILGSGGFYSLPLTQHAPQWRNPYTLSLSIALGNVFNDIWWLKARCSHPMIKKLMIKAL